MSSPYSRDTNRGTEETIEAMNEADMWLSRIDTSNDATELDVSSFQDDLQEEYERVKWEHKVKTTEVAIDNFVFNHIEAVKDIMCGSIDDRVDALDELESFIEDEFGYINGFSLERSELLWLVAQEVKYHQESSNGLDEYSADSFYVKTPKDEDSIPEPWDDGEFPKFNRN